METSRTPKRGCPDLEHPKKKTKRGSDKAGPSSLSAVGNKVSPGYKEEALSNFLVLKKILGFLNNDDLETCREVSKFWKSIADPMYISYYEVEIMRERGLFDPPGFIPALPELYTVTITKNAASKNPKKRKYTCTDACKWLEEALKVENISISLRVRERLGSAGMEFFDGFLTKFGHVVQEFTLTDDVTTIASFCGSLSRHFSNLKHLDLSRCLRFLEGTGHSLKAHNQLQNLKKITFNKFTLYLPELATMVAILSMAPNLEEIYNFQILLVEALVSTRKGPCVKSLEYPPEPDEEPQDGEDDNQDEPNPMTFVRALKILSQLGPKLSTFTFRVFDDFPKDILLSARFRPFVMAVLKSSSATLQELTLLPSETFHFQDIPPMVSLKKIEFVLTEGFADAKVFSPDVDLQQLFPSVTILKFEGFKSDTIASYFPQEQYSSWGSQIEELQMKRIDEMTADVINSFGKSFPSVKNFQFQIKDAPKDMKPILPAIAEQWPALNYLSVQIKGCHRRAVTDQQCTYDSVFTGFSDQTIAELQDPFFRSTCTPEEIKNFSEASVIRKLSRLKTLELDFGSCTDFGSLKRLSTITSISREFGFQFLPELKLIRRTDSSEREIIIPEKRTEIDSDDSGDAYDLNLMTEHWY